MTKPEKTPVGYMFDCLLDDVRADDKGHIYITLKTHAKVNDDIFSLSGQPLECAIKTMKAKKSNNANAYCWELCAAIATNVRLSSQEVYQDAIKHRGMYKDHIVHEDKIEEAKELWSQFGIGWFTELVDIAPENSVILRCYYGSSVYNSSQMALVIDYLVNEAQNLGITVLSSRTKDELIEKWEPCVKINNENFVTSATKT